MCCFFGCVYAYAVLLLLWGHLPLYAVTVFLFWVQNAILDKVNHYISR